MCQHEPYGDRFHLVVDRSNQPGVVVSDVEHRAIPHGIGILPGSPDVGQIPPRRPNSLHDPNPGAERTFPGRVLLLRILDEVPAENLHT